MTTTEAEQLGSGDEVGRGYYIGIVMRASDKSVEIFWETQKMGETTTYSKASAELRAIALKCKACRKRPAPRETAQPTVTPIAPTGWHYL